MVNLLILFIVLSIVNVVLNTIKSIVTVNGGKMAAAIINAITFFVYTYVIIYTNCELPMLTKAIITGVVNFVGVYVVKWIEEKAKKDKLWLVKMTIPKENYFRAKSYLDKENVSYSYIDINKYIVFDTYCYTQEETTKVEKICRLCKGKLFATESKINY